MDEEKAVETLKKIKKILDKHILIIGWMKGHY